MFYTEECEIRKELGAKISRHSSQFDCFRPCSSSIVHGLKRNPILGRTRMSNVGLDSAITDKLERRELHASAGGGGAAAAA